MGNVDVPSSLKKLRTWEVEWTDLAIEGAFEDWALASIPSVANEPAVSED